MQVTFEVIYLIASTISVLFFLQILIVRKGQILAMASDYLGKLWYHLYSTTPPGQSFLGFAITESEEELDVSPVRTVFSPSIDNSKLGRSIVSSS